MTHRTIITPDAIDSAVALIYRQPNIHLPTRPLPTTPARRQQAIIAAGREALARVLMCRYGLKNYGALTKAIRAGHDGDATDFAAINRRGAEALGLL